MSRSVVQQELNAEALEQIRQFANVKQLSTAACEKAMALEILKILKGAVLPPNDPSSGSLSDGTEIVL